MIDLMVLNDVYSRTDGCYRYLSEVDDGYVLIDIDESNAMPKVVNFEQIDKEVREGTIFEVEDPWLSSVQRNYSPDHSYIKMRNDNFNLIKDIVTHPEFYRANIRGAITQILVDKGVAAKSTLYRYARRYWQRGQNINALLPDYAKCGIKIDKDNSPDGRANRSSKSLDKKGVDISSELEDLMHSAVMDTILSDRYRIDLKGKKQNLFNLEKAYVELLLRYCKGNINALDDEKPSKALFKAYYYKKFTPEQRAQAKHGKKYFNANLKPISSTVRANLPGPATSVIVDSTSFDIGTANEDRFPLGRPTLYVATDEYTSAIVGFLLTLTPPSYFNAVNCITMAVTSKAEFCRSLGLEEHANKWIMDGLYQALFCDLGSDYKTKDLDQFISTFHCSIKHSPAGNPAMRAVGEKVFDRIHEQIIHKVPGVVSEYLPKKAGGKNSQAQYTLLLQELNKLIVKAVITLNDKPLAKWDGDADFPSDLAKTPNNIWKWGITNKTGLLQTVDRDHFWYSLLKREQATVSNNLLKIDKVQYVCPTLSGLRLKQYNSRKKVTVVRDMDDASAIFLVPDDGDSEYIRCELEPHFRRFEGKPWADVLIALKKGKTADDEAMHEYYKTSVEDLAESKVLVAQAVKDRDEKVGDLSKSEKLKDLGNKEKQRQQSSQSYQKVKPAAPAAEPEIYEPIDMNSIGSSQTQFFMDDED
jgi:transposase InsO family protein